MDSRVRYAQVGLGVRSWIYSLAATDRGALVGLCDVNPGRLAQRARWAAGRGTEPLAVAPEDFPRLLDETRPDCVIVTPPDGCHADYIVRSLEHGCDVISEKPLTVDAEGVQRILDAQRTSGRRCTVTFNYRYSPPREQVKELLAAGAIGEVLSVDFAWWLDTRHGADYFRRWHRRSEMSGGLLVHKASHHFDLVNWWLDSRPVRVQASGRLAYYTPGTADAIGLQRRGDRCLDCPEAGRCPFHLDLRDGGLLQGLYLDHESHDGYWRDRCVFDADIDILDTMNVLVDYANGARLAYSLNAFMPHEGYRVAFNGTRGRLEHQCIESSYVSGSHPVMGATDEERTHITLHRVFDRPETIPVRTAQGSHSGGDARLIDDLFAPPAGDGVARDDPLGRSADHRAGAWAALTGIAANRSIRAGAPVDPGALVSGLA